MGYDQSRALMNLGRCWTRDVICKPHIGGRDVMVISLQDRLTKTGGMGRAGNSLTLNAQSADVDPCSTLSTCRPT